MKTKHFSLLTSFTLVGFMASGTVLATTNAADKTSFTQSAVIPVPQISSPKVIQITLPLDDLVAGNSPMVFNETEGTREPAVLSQSSFQKQPPIEVATRIDEKEEKTTILSDLNTTTFVDFGISNSTKEGQSEVIFQSSAELTLEGVSFQWAFNSPVPEKVYRK
jgi:hypothetical protein